MMVSISRAPDMETQAHDVFDQVDARRCNPNLEHFLVVPESLQKFSVNSCLFKFESCADLRPLLLACMSDLHVQLLFGGSDLGGPREQD